MVFLTNTGLPVNGSCRQHAQWSMVIVAVTEPPVGGRAKGYLSVTSQQRQGTKDQIPMEEL